MKEGIITLKERAKNLVGCTFMYRAKTYKLLQVYDNNQKLTLATDRKVFEIENDELTDFFDEVLDVDAETESLEQVRKEIQSVSNKTVLKGLSEILFDNIQKIQESPHYIEQADAINNQAKSIINIAKVEIGLMKLMKKND